MLLQLIVSCNDIVIHSLKIYQVKKKNMVNKKIFISYFIFFSISESCNFTYVNSILTLTMEHMCDNTGKQGEGGDLVFNNGWHPLPQKGAILFLSKCNSHQLSFFPCHTVSSKSVDYCSKLLNTPMVSLLLPGTTNDLRIIFAQGNDWTINIVEFVLKLY